jgi:uncharacterized membrane protein
MVILGFTPLDILAFGWFVVCWVGFTWSVEHSQWRRPSLSTVMNDYRRQWMLTMLRRDDPRIVDTTIQASLLNGIAFFASISIIVVGGLIAMLGATEQAMRVMEDLPFLSQPSPAAWELKIFLLILIFIYAFFKFAWSFRLLKYCSILIGAVPSRDEVDTRSEQLVTQIAELMNLEAKHFNRGLRAQLFSLAVLGWFIHPLLFMAATAWVALVNYYREFHCCPLHPHDLEPTSRPEPRTATSPAANAKEQG